MYVYCALVKKTKMERLAELNFYQNLGKVIYGLERGEQNFRYFFKERERREKYEKRWK